jgi:hypothetical protein
MKRFIGLALLGFTAFAGCGGSSTEGGGTNAAPVAKEKFAGELAKAVCTNIGPCCQQAGYTHDAVKCTASLEGLYQNMVAGNVLYDAQKGGNCIAYAAGAMKNCDDDPAPGPCESVATGTVPDGGKCAASAECIGPPGGDAYCNDGVCVQTPRGKLGDGCSGTCTEAGSSTSCSGGSGGASGGNALCYTNDGFVCGSEGKCAPLAPIGEACTEGGCVATAYCQYPSEKCVSRVAVGGACEISNECAEGAYCTAGKCATTKLDGAGCEEWEECASGKCEAAKCGSSGMVSSQVCSGSTSK